MPSVSIFEVVGVGGVSGRPDTIRIRGASEDCFKIEVRLSCEFEVLGGAGLGPTSVVEEVIRVDPDAAGLWDLSIPSAQAPVCIGCGRPMRVVALCIGESGDPDPAAAPAMLETALPCPGPSCPDVRATALVSNVCNVDGTRTVTYTVSVLGEPETPVRWRLYLDGGGWGVDSSSRLETIPYQVNAETPKTLRPALEILEPAGCPLQTLPPVNVPLCPAALQPPGPPPCPSLTRLTADSIETLEGGCRVAWVADTDPPGSPGTFTWRFDDEPPLEPQRSRVQLKTYTSSGEKVAIVTFTPDRPGCASPRLVLGIEVENCDGVPGGGDERRACLVGRVALVSALATSLAALGLGIALPKPAVPITPQVAYGIAAAFAAIFLILTIIWALRCNPKPCSVGMLITGQAMFGAGVLLTNLAKCCPELAYVGAGLALAGIGLLLGWRARCDKSWCDFASEVGFISSGVLLQAIAILGFICGDGPSLFDNPWPAAILLIFNTLGVASIFGLIACRGRDSRDAFDPDALSDEDLARLREIRSP